MVGDVVGDGFRGGVIGPVPSFFDVGVLAKFLGAGKWLVEAVGEGVACHPEVFIGVRAFAEVLSWVEVKQIKVRAPVVP